MIFLGTVDDMVAPPKKHNSKKPVERLHPEK